MEVKKRRQDFNIQGQYQKKFRGIEKIHLKNVNVVIHDDRFVAARIKRLTMKKKEKLPEILIIS